MATRVQENLIYDDIMIMYMSTQRSMNLYFTSDISTI